MKAERARRERAKGRVMNNKSDRDSKGGGVRAEEVKKQPVTPHYMAAAE